MVKKKNPSHYAIIIALLAVSFVASLFVYDSTIRSVKSSKDNAIEQLRDHDFNFIWDYLKTLTNLSEHQTVLIAGQIEQDIRDNFDLDQLSKALEEGSTNKTEINKLHQVFRDNVVGVHLGGLENNRNSMIVLEGYNLIMEDMFIDPNSRSKKKSFDGKEFRFMSDYRQTTYNLKLFDSAMRKIRTHSDQPIAMEPYNYLEEDHTKISEMSYSSLKGVYEKEGLVGLKNYQFMIPAYITDTGDIFGQYDTVNGIPQANHKFVVIQTFNLYDQLMHINPDFGDAENIEKINNRYDTILNSLYIFGMVVCAIIFIIILYFFTLYNVIIDRERELLEHNNTIDS